MKKKTSTKRKTVNGIKSNVISRLSSYQKLKLENEKLRQDIYNLVRKEKEMIGIETKMRYEMEYQLGDVVWMGSPSVNNEQSTFNGLLNAIR